MTAGSDKIIAFDPPGSIGLTNSAPVVLLRLHDTDVATLPKDEAGALADMAPPAGTVAPTVTDAAMGKGRRFSPAGPSVLAAQDITPGASLLTRDLSIMAIVSWDIAAQAAAGFSGTIVARGKGSAAAEYTAYCLQLGVANLGSRQGTIFWSWQDTAGALHVQAGAQFTVPASGFTLFTATRRWISPTSVVLRYYIGDVLLGEVASSDGDIGGGTTGTFYLGTHWTGAFDQFFAGVMDEILILNHELTLQEIEATWLRITRYQPLGYQLIKEMHDPGFPLPTDPGSDVQRDLRMIGHSLGYAAAQAEDVRANILPQRAYGSVLEDWKTVLRVTPAPNQGIDEQRNRVLARMRQRRGCTILGLEDILPSVIGGADVEDLEFLAFSNEIDDTFTAIDPLRWDVTPAGAFAAVAGAASCAPGPGSFFMDGATWPPTWLTMRQTVGGDGKQAHQLAKLVFTTPQAQAEAGIYFECAHSRDYLLLGLRDVGGSFRIETESFIGGVSQGVVQQAIIGANPAAIWLHLYQTSIDGTWGAAWSTTSATTGFSASAGITHPTRAHWAGCYLRSVSALGAGPRADFDDHRLLAPFSGRPFNAYVLLDRALGFSPDVEGARSVISAIKHGFTHGTFITSRAFLAGDPDSGAGLAPCGGY